MTDFTHLDALQSRLSHEIERLTQAKSTKERDLRAVWVAGIEREIEAEYRFLGIEQTVTDNISDDELLAELMA